MVDEPTFEPERVVAALNAAGVRYVIVGGLAVAAHGVVRATRDLDIVPDGTADNVDLLAQILTALGGAHPINGPLTGDSLSRPVTFTVRTRHGDVQVLNRMASVPPFEVLYGARIDVPIAPDAVAPVCSLTHLRAMKLAAGRPRDLVDLVELDELHGESQA